MRILTALLTAPFALAVAACSDSTAPADGVPPGARVVVATPVDSAPSFRSQNTGVAVAERTVVRDAAAWAALWDRVAGFVIPRPPAPAVDFARDMVLFAAAGSRSSGGYSLGFGAVYESGGTYYAVVVESVPGQRCLSAGVITTPAAAVSVARATGPVRFVEKRETVECA